MSDPKVDRIRDLDREGWSVSIAQQRYLLTKLDEVEREIEVQRRNALLNYGAYVQAHRRAEAAEERERVLIAGVKETLALEPFRFADADDPERNPGDPVLWQSEVVAILSRLLPSTPIEEGKE